MSLLSISQDVAHEVGFTPPSKIVGNADSGARQLLRLANRVGEEISQNHRWQILAAEHTITLVAGTQTYAIPDDMRWIVPMTTWDRTTRRPVANPVTPAQWAYLKGWATIDGLDLEARINGDRLDFQQDITAAEAGEQIYFEYLSNKWAATSAGTPRRRFQADTDTSRLDEELLTQGVVWRFKKGKGLDDWVDDKAEFMRLLELQKARDGGSRVISLGGDLRTDILGVNIPDRNFG